MTLAFHSNTNHMDIVIVNYVKHCQNLHGTYKDAPSIYTGIISVNFISCLSKIEVLIHLGVTAIFLFVCLFSLYG